MASKKKLKKKIENCKLALEWYEYAYAQAIEEHHAALEHLYSKIEHLETELAAERAFSATFTDKEFEKKPETKYGWTFACEVEDVDDYFVY